MCKSQGFCFVNYLKMRNIIPTAISRVPANGVFVFGSNEAGIHGDGAARLAVQSFGATFGRGFGFSGKSFAIPTKDSKITTLPLEVIGNYIKRFVAESKLHPENFYFVTAIGCGLAGYTASEIAPMFFALMREELPNYAFPAEFFSALDSFEGKSN